MLSLIILSFSQANDELCGIYDTCFQELDVIKIFQLVDEMLFFPIVLWKDTVSKNTEICTTSDSNGFRLAWIHVP